MRIAGIVDDSIVDGPGLRLTVFFQGCARGCEGCHNPHTHDYAGGYEMTIGDVMKLVDGNPLLDGVTLSGGEPFDQAREAAELAREIKKRGLTVVTYTGYVAEELLEDESKRALVESSDILVDGAFILAERTMDLPYVGSRNQRVINVKEL